MEELFRELKGSGNYDAIVIFSLLQAATAEANFKVLNLSSAEKNLYKKIFLKKLENEIINDEEFERFKNRV